MSTPSTSGLSVELLLNMVTFTLLLFKWKRIKGVCTQTNVKPISPVTVIYWYNGSECKGGSFFTLFIAPLNTSIIYVKNEATSRYMCKAKYRQLCY